MHNTFKSTIIYLLYLTIRDFHSASLHWPRLARKSMASNLSKRVNITSSNPRLSLAFNLSQTGLVKAGISALRRYP